MLIRTSVVAVLFCSLTAGCGGDDGSGGSGDSPSGGDACTGSGCGEIRVTINVSSPLPSELTTGCGGGNIAALDGYVLNLLDDNGVCFVTVTASGVSGTCQDVLADRSVHTTLVFRVTSGNVPIAEQGKLLELPSTSPSTVDLSFAGVMVDRARDTDSDGIDNLQEWCDGTL